MTNKFAPFDVTGNDGKAVYRVRVQFDADWQEYHVVITSASRRRGYTVIASYSTTDAEDAKVTFERMKREAQQMAQQDAELEAITF